MASHLVGLEGEQTDDNDNYDDEETHSKYRMQVPTMIFKSQDLLACSTHAYLELLYLTHENQTQILQFGRLRK